MRLAPLFIVALALLAPPAAADPASAQRYVRCVQALNSQPQAAFDLASVWRSEGGGAPAKHCQAMALIALEQPLRAAGVLDSAGEDMDKAGLPNQAADLYAQAGNAWLLGGDPARSYERLTRALERLPSNSPRRVEALLDRARALHGMKDSARAVTDLTTALGLAPQRADLLLLRATSYRLLGNVAAARTDIQAAHALTPKDAEIDAEAARIAALTPPQP
jgi:tetratricopeptide (TPR) repeat protein